MRRGPKNTSHTHGKLKRNLPPKNSAMQTYDWGLLAAELSGELHTDELWLASATDGSIYRKRPLAVVFAAHGRRH